MKTHPQLNSFDQSSVSQICCDHVQVRRYRWSIILQVLMQLALIKVAMLAKNSLLVHITGG